MAPHYVPHLTHLTGRWLCAVENGSKLFECEATVHPAEVMLLHAPAPIVIVDMPN